MNPEEAINHYLACDMPRSEAFKYGLAAGFIAMRDHVPTHCQYKCGTAECDAFFGGRLEGMKLYEQEKQQLTVY